MHLCIPESREVDQCVSNAAAGQSVAVLLQSYYYNSH